MSFYLLPACTVLIFALYGLRCAKVPELSKRCWPAALLSLVLASVLGVCLARVSYAALMLELDFEYDGIAALADLLDLNYDNMSFFGGAVGACLGVVLANRIMNKGHVLTAMDAFAPFGALLVALYRVWEINYGSYGAGASIPDGSPFAVFPFALHIAVDGNYSYNAWAICMLSALFAVIWAAVAFFGLRGKKQTGWCFTLTLFFLALPQVLCESMRRRGMFWLFVHVEQLLCAVLMFAVLLYWCLKAKGKLPLLKRWLPCLVMLVCVGLIVATEFAIDGKLFDFSPTACYCFMTVVLIVLGTAGVTAARRWRDAA